MSWRRRASKVLNDAANLLVIRDRSSSADARRYLWQTMLFSAAASIIPCMMAANWGWATNSMAHSFWGSWTDPVVYRRDNTTALGDGGGIEHLACVPASAHKWLDFGVAPAAEAPQFPWATLPWRDPFVHGCAIAFLTPTAFFGCVACSGNACSTPVGSHVCPSTRPISWVVRLLTHRQPC